MNLADAPDWYKFVWLKHQREVKKCSDDAIGRILDRYTENTGKRVYLPDCEGFVVPEPKGIDDDDEEADEETTGRSRQYLEHSSVIQSPYLSKGPRDLKRNGIQELLFGLVFHTLFLVVWFVLLLEFLKTRHKSFSFGVEILLQFRHCFQ